MSIRPRRLLILRWTRDHPALGAPARWLFHLPLPAHRASRSGSRTGVAACVATLPDRRGA
jgi:hypothetical protein